ncbi:MAG: FAD/NAD(P)-binding protein [Ignisphaera sp.]|uniref:Ni/Fe hydrogenase subunit gamma n=1 Tax=Ignisphaera aggregans TaxID=334771 RepID=A0A7J3I8Y7_9CREN
MDREEEKLSIFAFRRAIVVNEIEEAPNVKTLAMKFSGDYNASPGQFNMIYVYGLGEVPISLANLPKSVGRSTVVEHTIRNVGAITKAVVYRISIGSIVGIRGPYGRGWPLNEVEGRDILIIGGGIGMAPLRPTIKYIEKSRERFGRINILFGARTPQDMLYKYELDSFKSIPNTKLMLSVDTYSNGWQYYVGFVTDLINYVDTDVDNAVAFLCGPEPMMRIGVKKLLDKGFRKDCLFLSLERRMRCGVGVCGTCQFGQYFICRNGPVFRYSDIEDYIWVEGI